MPNLKLYITRRVPITDSNTISLDSNRHIKINFDGGDLSSDAGLLLIKGFISRILRKRIYSIKLPEAVIPDLDSTLLDAYGKQEGRAFNFHYQGNGYHPLACYDSMTGDLIKIQLRHGTKYSFTGVVDFLQPVLDEFLDDYLSFKLLLRGDSGFATPDLYQQCEENVKLRDKASFLEDELDDITKTNKVDYAVVYGKFMYQASSRHYARRVVCKVEKQENQLVYMHTFIVTNMDSSPEYLIRFYCKRGLLENFIKESKAGFDFASVTSHTRIVNANRLQVHALAYNIFNWFRHLVLSARMRKKRIDIIRLKMLKIAAKVIHSARYMKFKLCSSCPYKNEFYETLSNLGQLKVQLE